MVANNSASGYFWLIGTSTFRSASLGACRNGQGHRAAFLEALQIGTTPEVESVTAGATGHSRDRQA